MEHSGALLASTLVLGMGMGGGAAVAALRTPETPPVALSAVADSNASDPAVAEAAAPRPTTVKVCVKKGLVVAPRSTTGRASKRCPKSAKLTTLHLRGERGAPGARGPAGADGSGSGAMDGGAP